MAPLTELSAAYKQGYMRGIYKAMDAVHTAIRRQWAPDIQKILDRMASEQEAEAEVRAFVVVLQERMENRLGG